jgi:hypothetical protein
MAADNMAAPGLPLPPLLSASSRPDRDSLTAPSPPALAASVGPNAAPPVTAPAPHQHHDPALDPAIKQLLDQQAEIQARLAALLPQRYGPNIKMELEMLRHKLRVLRAYADDHRKLLSFLFFFLFSFFFYFGSSVHHPRIHPYLLASVQLLFVLDVV